MTSATALPTRPNINSAYVAPGSELQQSSAASWQRTRGIARIGLHDHFFDLGDSSLPGIQLVAELKKRLNVDLATVSIFGASTIAALACYLSPEQTTHSNVQGSRNRALKKFQRKRKA